jgi:bacterioferritin-associated ferredoxin
MIVCSCNVLTDHEVRDAARSASRRSTSHVYGCLGCSAQCGRCARTIRKIIDETIGSSALACPVGCACAMHINGAEEHHKHERRPVAGHAHTPGHVHHHPHVHAERADSEAAPAA